MTTIFVLMNVVAIFHSYKFTHFTKQVVEKTKNPKKLNTLQKLNTLIFGVNNPTFKGVEFDPFKCRIVYTEYKGV